MTIQNQLPSFWNLFIIITLLFTGCSKNETVPPEPSFTHTITINGNIEGATYQTWKNGNTTATRTADSQGDAEFSFTDKSQNLSLDSITGKKEGYTGWKVGAQSIGTSKNYTATLEEIQNAQDFWVKGETNAKSIKGWKDGTVIMTWEGDPGTYETSKFPSTDATVTLDSLVAEGTNKVKQVETGVILQPNGTTKNINLDAITYLLKGITMDLVKDTLPPYDVTSADFINKRLLPNATFTIFSKDGKFEQEVTSDATAHFQLQVPGKGDYGVEIEMAGMHPMMYKIILDSLVNNENIAFINTTLSEYNFAQSHQGYKPSDSDPSVLVPNGSNRTLNLSKDLQENARLLFLKRVRNDMTGELGDTINQEMVNLFQETFDYIDRYENGFFGNKNLKFVEDISNFADDGVFAFKYFTGVAFGGEGGHTTKGGIVISVGAGVNEDLYEKYKDYGYQHIKTILLQEITTTTSGAFFELWKTEEGKPSVWYKSSTNEKFTDNDKQATEVYHWILHKYTAENDLPEGFYAGFLDSRIAKDFNNLQRVQNYIQNNALPDIQEKYLN